MPTNAKLGYQCPSDRFRREWVESSRAEGWFREPLIEGCSAQAGEGGVEGGARTHGRRRQGGVGEVVAADVDRPALHGVEFVDDGGLVGGEAFGQRGEAGGQGGVGRLRREGLRPVQRQVELAAPVVELAALP